MPIMSLSSIRSHVRKILLGLVAALVLPQFALADPPADPKEQSVPVQLTLIREYLAEMDERLTRQIADVESNLESKIGDVQSSVDLGNSKIDDLQASADQIYAVVTAVNVDITTQLCLDEAAMVNIQGGANGRLGAGWDEVLDVEANVSIEAVFGAQVGLGNQLCIQIPLYSVASAEPLSDYFAFDTSEFDDMIADVASGARSVVPVFAAVYTALAPTPEEATEALENYVIAVSGRDLYGNPSGKYGPEHLLAPDVLLEPVIPDFIEDFIAQVPELAEDFANHPCENLNSMSPFGSFVDTSKPELNFLCGTTAQALTLTLTGIKTVVDSIATVVNWIWDIFDV